MYRFSASAFISRYGVTNVPRQDRPYSPLSNLKGVVICCYSMRFCVCTFYNRPLHLSSRLPRTLDTISRALTHGKESRDKHNGFSGSQAPTDSGGLGRDGRPHPGPKLRHFPRSKVNWKSFVFPSLGINHSLILLRRSPTTVMWEAFPTGV